MSVMHVNENNAGKQYDEKLIRYKQLLTDGNIVKDYINNNTTMKLSFDDLENYDWDIILDITCAKEYPLRDLKLTWKKTINESIESDYIKLAKMIANNTTLRSFECYVDHISLDGRGAEFFKELKNNHSMQRMRLQADHCDSNTIQAFSPILINNQTLRSLKISFYTSPSINSRDDCWAPIPIPVEIVSELARLLETTSALERLELDRIDNAGFKILIKSFPKTLTYLDLESNDINEESIPHLQSYLELNNNTLRNMILPYDFPIEQLKENESSLSIFETININSYWMTEILRNSGSLRIDSRNMSDRNWSDVFRILTKSHTLCHELNLFLSDNINENILDYIRPLISKQSSLTSLILSFYYLNTSVPIDLFQQLKENQSITQLQINYSMDSNVFNEFIKLLMKKKNIIRLCFSENRDFTDEQAVQLRQVLKTYTVLRSLTISESSIGDIGFQALLSSLPNALSQSIINDNLISSKSLPSLYNFMQTHSNVKYISLNENGISLDNSIDINASDLMNKIFKIANKNDCICLININEKVKNVMENLANDSIDLTRSRLRDDHILELCNGLKKHSNRNWSLDLGSNERISYVGYQYLAEVLSSTINIIELSVDSNQIDEKGRIDLLNGLRSNKTIKKFTINYNTLNSEDMKSIAVFVKNNPMLKAIYFYHCEMDADGAVHLASTLSESCLEILDLYAASIGDHGCSSILSSIPSTLNHLVLDYNQITESSLQIILTFLSTNKTLKILEIRSNPIFENSTCSEQICQMAEQNNICELK